MSRAVWFTAGVASGVYGVVRAKRVIANFTPDGISARLAAWRLGLQLFADEVTTGMAKRESELRDELRLEQSEQRALERGRDQSALKT